MVVCSDEFLKNVCGVWSICGLVVMVVVVWKELIEWCFLYVKVSSCRFCDGFMWVEDVWDFYVGVLLEWSDCLMFFCLFLIGSE